MDPDLQIKSNVGCKELLLRKLSYAVTCSVLMQFVILTIFLFIVNFNILSPGKWFLSSLSTFTSFTTWLFLVPFLSVIFAQSMICAKDYVLKCTCCPTRISYFFSMFSLRNLVLLCLHTSSGGFFVWLHLSLAGGDLGSLIMKCDKRYCLNEECFYLVLFGVWTGLYYYLRIYSTEKNIIFPVIQQGKLLQFKSNLADIIKTSQKAAVIPVCTYVLLYYFFGDSSQDIFSAIINLHKSNSTHGIFTILYAWFFAFLFIFNMKLMRFFFEIFLTEPIEFPVVELNNADLTLTAAMNINNIPIIQHLSCLDFYLLSTSSSSRRQLIFSLSQPGNHPHNWNNLIVNVLDILNAYTQTMTLSINAILSTNKEIPEIKPQTTNQFVKNYSYGNMRNLTLPNFDMPVEFVNVTRAEPPKPTIVQNLQNKINSAIATFKKRTGIYFLFEALPMSNIEYLLLNGQIIIWTVQGLSIITVASLKEDKFGVMQKDLPVILSTLTELKLCMEKLNRIPALVRKSQRFDSYTSKMKYSVNSAVKRSLYHICNNFGPYLKDLPINNDVLQTLQPYVH